VPPTEAGRAALRDELMAYAKKNIAKYAMPYDIEFREDLPKTLVGKVAYRVLEEEEAAKRAKYEAEKAQAADAENAEK
jgi:long-chain acyl-CoA synthetase